MQLVISETGTINQYVTVNGCDDNNYSGKDVFYEIVVPTTGCYHINLYSRQYGFNYEIYSYNMYNGDYQVISEGNDIVQLDCNLTLIAKQDYANQHLVNKYYLRADFGVNNTFDKYIALSISNQHTYTDHYESISSTQHKAYCQCGAYELQNHSLIDNVCTACGEAHTHAYTDHYENNNLLSHKAYCWCGEYIFEPHQIVDGVCSLCGINHDHYYAYSWLTYVTHRKACTCGDIVIEPHVIEVGAIYDTDGYTTCLLCGGKVSHTGMILSISQLPHTDNGSYILSDGIIVLVEEDMEAYFNGILEFYNPNDNLETQ